MQRQEENTNIYQEELTYFELQYLDFGAPKVTPSSEEVCSCCPSMNRRFKVHAPYYCQVKDCQKLVCEKCVLCDDHSHYSCPRCFNDTFWKDCIFGDKELYNPWSGRNWKFGNYFPVLNEYPWFKEEVLVACHPCFEKVLLKVGERVSYQSFLEEISPPSSSLTISDDKKRKRNLSEETNKHVTRIETCFRNDQKFKDHFE
jgi:hypothetical protein